MNVYCKKIKKKLALTFPIGPTFPQIPVDHSGYTNGPCHSGWKWLPERTECNFWNGLFIGDPHVQSLYDSSPEEWRRLKFILL